MEPTSCPLCDSAQTFLVRRIAVRQLLDSWKKAFQIDISQYVEGIRQIDLIACERCHLQFYAPASVTGFSELYSQLQRFDWYYTPRKWEHDIALNELTEGNGILEIGCGSGEFIARAWSEKKLQVYGIDTNERAVRDAQRSGLRVQTMELQEAVNRWREHYDAVCAFQVLEHVPDPKQFLECSCQLLKPGGQLLLGLPNAESFLRYQFNPLDMPPHHMTKWSDRVVCYLPNLFPLRLVQIRQEPLAEYHVRDYVKAYCSAYVSKGVRRFFFPRWMQRSAVRFLQVTGLRKLVMGQTLYASFRRT